MAVRPMSRIHVCGMKRDRKAVLEYLQRRELVEISEISPEIEGPGPTVFQKADTAHARETFQKSLGAVREAREIIDKAVPPKKAGLAFLHGREAVTPEGIARFYEKYDDILHDAHRVLHLQQEAAEARAEVLRTEVLLEALRPWEALPVPISSRGTRRTALVIGSFDGERSVEDILGVIAREAPELSAIHAEPVWHSKVMTCLFFIVLRQDAPALERALSALGFSRPPGTMTGLPADQMRSLSEKKAAAQALIRQAEADIAACAFRHEDFKLLEDHLTLRLEKYEVIERMTHTRHTFALSGYVPGEAAPELQQALLTRFGCSVELEAAEEPGDAVPVLLKNRWFTEPTEMVLEGYSMPGKGELDPTGIMSIFYYITFGLMFSDAAYGAIIFFVCLFCLLRFKNMEPNWNRNIRLFMWCGLSTVLWGVVFSSYFGDVVDVVSQQFLGVRYTIPPLWFSPMENPMLLLVFSLGVGVVHLTAGYIMKGLTCIHQKDYAGVIYDMVFPIAAWYPLMAILIGSDLFAGLAGFKVTLPPVASQVCLIISALSIVGIILTGGRESRSWAKRIMKGLYALYSILSGWLSDILSYSRLLALGLATGVIASVMNQLGAMTGNSVFGAIAFLIIFLAGQGLNFGINVLGAYVHSNRLAYVEFFGKFYSGGGRKFAPFGVHTKYYKITQEEVQS